MRALGFSFTTQDFRVVSLMREGDTVTYQDKERILYPRGMTIPDLMGWCENEFGLLFSRYNPGRVAHKTSKEISKLNQVTYSCYPQAILNLVAKKSNIDIQTYSVQAINPTKFGLPKTENLAEYVDTHLGSHPPYWDKATREAALVAWFTLL